jgi:hypothetical protein
MNDLLIKYKEFSDIYSILSHVLQLNKNVIIDLVKSSPPSQHVEILSSFLSSIGIGIFVVDGNKLSCSLIGYRVCWAIFIDVGYNLYTINKDEITAINMLSKKMIKKLFKTCDPYLLETNKVFVSLPLNKNVFKVNLMNNDLYYKKFKNIIEFKTDGQNMNAEIDIINQEVEDELMNDEENDVGNDLILQLTPPPSTEMFNGNMVKKCPKGQVRNPITGRCINPPKRKKTPISKVEEKDGVDELIEMMGNTSISKNVVKETPKFTKCRVIMKSGPNKGGYCHKKAIDVGEYSKCKIHSKKVKESEMEPEIDLFNEFIKKSNYGIKWRRRTFKNLTKAQSTIISELYKNTSINI